MAASSKEMQSSCTKEKVEVTEGIKVTKIVTVSRNPLVVRLPRQPIQV